MAKRRFDWTPLRAPQAGAGDATTPAEPGDAIQPDAEWRRRAYEGDETPAPPAAPPKSAPLQPPEPTQSDGIELRVNDLKQFAYCPRIVFYQYTMPVERRATFKMEHGKAVEVRVEELERRRKLREYGLAEGTRHYQVWMQSPSMGLRGRVDLLIETPTGMFPVDFKDTTAPVRHNHHIQLCAYALLVESSFGRPVTTGFIYRVPRNDVVPVEISEPLREETLRTIQHIRTLIRTQRMPEPTTVRARCVDCEYRNYCGDVF